MKQQSELRDFMRLMRRRRGMLMRTILCAVALAAVYLFLATPKYEARALVLVDQAQKNLLEADPLRNALPTDSSHIESEVEILRSTAVALDVIAQADLVNDPDYTHKPGLSDRVAGFLGLWDPRPETEEEALGRVLAEFQEDTSVQRHGLSYVISVDIKASDPEHAAERANLLAKAYIDSQIRAKVEKSRVERDILESQILAATAAVDHSASALSRKNTQDQILILTARFSDLATQTSLQVPDSRIVAMALPPIKPGSPRKLLVLIAAIVGGTILGLGLVFLNEIYVDGVMSSKQLSDLADEPVSAILPKVSRRLWLSPPIAGLVVARPLSPFADAVRRLKTAVDGWLDFLPECPGENGRVILLTSAVAGEGATTLALSLARTYAQAGTRTLLIDADLRNPQVHTYSRKHPGNGLAEYLQHPDKIDLALTEDSDTGLSMILGNRDAKQATAHLVESEHFSDILLAARQDFDVIIIDSPAMMPAPDACYLARHADAVVLTVKHASTGRTVVQSAAQALVDAMPLEASLFTVLNQYQASQTDFDCASYDIVNNRTPVARSHRLRTRNV